MTLAAKKPEFKLRYPPPPVLKTWGDHIRKRRIELKLSREEVGKRVGVCVYAVRNWENNISNPNRRYHTAIIKFLGYDSKVRTKEYYGERIKDYLKSTGISRIKLASQVGVTPQAVHKWIHDMSMPPKGLLDRLLSVLDGIPHEPKEPRQ